MIGVAGGSGSGKSTVVDEVVRLIGSTRVSAIPHDAYYRDLTHLPTEERAATNFDHPTSLDTELLTKHIGLLLAGEAITVPTYDFVRHERRKETIAVEPTDLLILEGVLVLAEPMLRDFMDLKVYIDTDSDIRLSRRVRRDVAHRGRTANSVIEQNERSVGPMHLEFVEPSRRHADLVICGGGHNRTPVDLLVARLSVLLEQRPR